MLDRRTFLQTTSLALSLAVARRGWAGDVLVRQAATPQNLATPLEYFDRAITPTPVFFVRSHFGPPSFDKTRKLSIDGLVQTPLSLSVDDLHAFPEVTLTAVLQCAGSGRSFIEPRVPGVQWTHGAMGQATWTGVRLRDVLAKAGVSPEVLHARLTGADLSPKPTVPSFVRSVPLARALDPSTLLAYRMNGEPLPHAHGGPVRLVVPGWAGDHWTKWITQIHLQKEEAEGFYMQTAYKFPIAPGTPGVAVPPERMRSLTTFPVRSIIAKPADGSRVVAGPQEVVGVAFSGDAAIASVEISLDGGKTWRGAALEGEGGVGRWQVFRFRFVQKGPGRVSALVRATDKRGSKQPQNAVWNPGGYHWNGWHGVTWEVG